MQVRELMRFVLMDIAGSSSNRLKLLVDTFSQTPVPSRAALAQVQLDTPAAHVQEYLCSLPSVEATHEARAAPIARDDICPSYTIALTRPEGKQTCLIFCI